MKKVHEETFSDLKSSFNQVCFSPCPRGRFAVGVTWSSHRISLPQDPVVETTGLGNNRNILLTKQIAYDKILFDQGQFGGGGSPSGTGFWVAECLFGVTVPSVSLRHISHQIKCMALCEVYILQICNMSVKPVSWEKQAWSQWGH